MRGRVDFRLRRATEIFHRRLDVAPRREGRVDVEERRPLFPGDMRHPGGPPRGEMALGDHEKHRLAVIMHLAIREERLGHRRRRHVVGMGQIARRQHRDHAGRRAHRIEVEGHDARPRTVREPEGEVQGIGRARAIVDIPRRPRDMERAAVMRMGCPYAHASPRPEASRGGVCSCMSCQQRRSRFCATRIR